MNEKITVMIVDDHELVRHGIESYLSEQSELEIVIAASCGKDAILAAAEYLPDVILMDLNLGEGLNGIEATQKIKQQSPSCQIIVLTSYHSDEYIFPAIKAGALSYLLKDVHPEKLHEAIIDAANGRAQLAPSVAQRIVEEMQPSAEQQTYLSPLSKRELDVLKLVGVGMNNNEIADQLCISIKTVRCHVSNILSKLHLRDRTQVAVHAWKEGLVK